MWLNLCNTKVSDKDILILFAELNNTLSTDACKQKLRLKLVKSTGTWLYDLEVLYLSLNALFFVYFINFITLVFNVFGNSDEQAV